MRRSETWAFLIGAIGLAVLLYTLEKCDGIEILMGALFFIITSTLCISLFSKAANRTIDKAMARKEDLLVFTITYPGPLTGKNKTLVSNNYFKVSKRLEMLSKRNIKYKVDVAYKKGE